MSLQDFWLCGMFVGNILVILGTILTMALALDSVGHMQTQLPVALILMLIIYMQINQQQNFKHHCSSGPPYPLMALQNVFVEVIRHAG